MKSQDLGPITLGKPEKEHLYFIPLLQQLLSSVIGTNLSGDQCCFIQAPERKGARGKKMKPTEALEIYAHYPKTGLICSKFTQLLALGFL